MIKLNPESWNTQYLNKIFLEIYGQEVQERSQNISWKQRLKRVVHEQIPSWIFTKVYVLAHGHLNVMITNIPCHAYKQRIIWKVHGPTIPPHLVDEEGFNYESFLH